MSESVVCVVCVVTRTDPTRCLLGSAVAFGHACLCVLVVVGCLGLYLPLFESPYRPGWLGGCRGFGGDACVGRRSSQGCALNNNQVLYRLALAPAPPTCTHTHTRSAYPGSLAPDNALPQVGGWVLAEARLQWIALFASTVNHTPQKCSNAQLFPTACVTQTYSLALTWTLDVVLVTVRGRVKLGWR